jgi:hypothetical protein
LDEKTTGFNQGAGGLRVFGAFQMENNRMLLSLKITNLTKSRVDVLECQIKPNPFGLKSEKNAALAIEASATREIHIALNKDGSPSDTAITTPLMFQIGLKTSIDLFVFSVPCMLHILLGNDGGLSKEDFKTQWKSIAPQNEMASEIPAVKSTYQDIESLKKILGQNGISFVASKVNDAKQSTHRSSHAAVNLLST